MHIWTLCNMQAMGTTLSYGINDPQKFVNGTFHQSKATSFGCVVST